MKAPMTFIAAGDSFITRRVPSKEAQSFRELASVIQQADVKFTNLEVSVHNFEGFPSAVSGGTWAAAPPEVLSDIKDYGFNLIAWANNHTLDYSYGGLTATERYLDKYEFIHAGVGKNLTEASAPKYLECPNGRVALIAATSTFHECWMAGEQRPDMIGRPGINPLRYTNIYLSPQEQLKRFESAAKDLGFPVLKVRDSISNETIYIFGSYRFKVGEKKGNTSIPQEKDLNRIQRSIIEASRRADYVLVSIHSHEPGENPFQPADFLKEFARRCIDAGAHAVIGHGPHLLRPIEIYKNRPIFYSLGNFIFQSETVAHLPWDFYEQYGLNHENNIADAFDERRRKIWGFDNVPFVWESVIVFWSMEAGEIKELKLYPIELGSRLPRYRRGWPELSTSRHILETMQRLSLPYGTKLNIDHDVGESYRSATYNP